jgi:hypothetical protein
MLIVFDLRTHRLNDRRTHPVRPPRRKPPSSQVSPVSGFAYRIQRLAMLVWKAMSIIADDCAGDLMRIVDAFHASTTWLPRSPDLFICVLRTFRIGLFYVVWRSCLTQRLEFHRGRPGLLSR